MIDSNVYWFDETLFENEKELNRFLTEVNALKDTQGILKMTPSGSKQIVIEKPAGCENLNYIQGDYHLEKILNDMDRAGIDQAVLKVPGCAEWMSLKMCKRFNTGMAEYAAKSNGRLIPLGVVPPILTAEVVEEIDRCRNELGIKGFQLASHYQDKYLDDPLFEPFFQKMNEQETTIYVHHSPVPVEFETIKDYNNLRRSYGRCMDQSIAVGREVFSGFFEKFPNLRLVHSMLGGGFFAFENMLFPHSSQNEEVTRFETHDQLKRLYKDHIYFEMSHAAPWGKAPLECAIRVFGSDHVLFGSSWPVRKEWMLEGADFIQSLNLTEDEKENVLHRNAQRLYGIDL